MADSVSGSLGRAGDLDDLDQCEVAGGLGSANADPGLAFRANDGSEEQRVDQLEPL
jgi:hypothetical protein